MSDEMTSAEPVAESQDFQEVTDLPLEGEAQDQVEAESVEASESSVEAETVEELKDEVADAIEEGASDEEVAEMVKEFELKVNGKKVKKTIDLSDEEALRRELQLSAAGQSAMQRMRELEKAYEQEVTRLKEDPWSVLKELDMDPDQLAEERIRDKIEELKKSPEQIERERIQKELEDARAELQRQKDEAEAARFEQLQDKAAAELESEITDALDAHTTLPKSPKTIARIADTMLWAMENGLEDVTVEDVIPSVESDIRREFGELMDAIGEESLEQYIGKKNIERLRKRRLTSMKPKTVNEVKPTTKSEQLKETKEKSRVRARDYFKNL